MEGLELKSVLMICTGNTCRSVMAAALLKEHAVQAGIDLKVESAGLAAFTGDSATEHTIQVMDEVSLDVASHRARLWRTELIDEFDLILVMTQAHKQHILSTLPEDKDKVFQISEYADSHNSQDVSDPFGQSLTEYRKVRDELSELMQRIVSNWKKEAN